MLNSMQPLKAFLRGVWWSGRAAVFRATPFGRSFGFPSRLPGPLTDPLFAKSLDRIAISEMAKKTTKLRPWTKEEARMLRSLARERTKTVIAAGRHLI
jgi:hypothetical protein